MRALTAVLVLAALALVTCTSDADPSPTPPATPTPEATPRLAPTSTPPPATSTPEPTPTSPPGPRRTGDHELDAIIEAVEERDVDALVALQRTEVVTCRSTDEPSIGSPPTCEELGVPEGTDVTVASGASCEGFLTTDGRGLLEHFVARQDGLYAVSRGGDGYSLVFHGGLLHAGFALDLWVVDGQLSGVSLGCAQPPEFYVENRDTVWGPWLDPLTPESEAVGVMMSTFLDAIESRDAEAFASLMDDRPSARGCGLAGEDRQQIAEHFLELNPSLVGVYERLPGVWLAVYELDTGAGRFEVSGSVPLIRAFFYPCDRTIEELTTDGLGQPLERIELPSE